MEVSQDTRDRVEAHLAAKTTRRTSIAGPAKVSEVSRPTTSRRMRRSSGSHAGILRYLATTATARSVVRKGAASRARDYFDDALERLIAAGRSSSLAVPTVTT